MYIYLQKAQQSVININMYFYGIYFVQLLMRANELTFKKYYEVAGLVSMPQLSILYALKNESGV